MAYVHGTYQVIEDAIDYVYGLMGNLKTAMAAVTPHIDYVYKGHNQANLRLNAVTVDLESFDRESAGIEAPIKPFMMYKINISVRVHVNYAGQYTDGIKVARLLNSIDNYLSTHIVAGNYRIWGFGDASNYQSFDVSQTVGGEISVILQRTIDHTQA